MPTATRIRFTVDSQTKELIVKAAALRGQSLSQFANDALVCRARQLMSQDEQTVLNDHERDRFLALLDADTKPNAALKKAARMYRRIIEGRK